MKVPSLCVVIPNFNHGYLIGDQLRSIFAQTIQCARIIVIDDASTDNSVSTIQGLITGHSNVELICKTKNSGVSEVINEGLRLADCEFVAFLAADDKTLPGFFEKSLTLLSLHPDAALCSGVSLVHYRSGDYVLPSWTTYPCSSAAFLTPTQVRESLLRSDGWFMGNTTIFRRQPLLAAGGLDPKLRSFSDGFISRVLALRHGACFIPEPLAIWRRVDAGYAGSTSRDLHESEEILIESNTQMTTIFKDLFPPELLARCKARMLFQVLCVKLGNFEQRTRSIVDAVQPLAVGTLLVLAARSASAALKLLFLFILRPYDIPRAALSRLFRKRSAV